MPAHSLRPLVHHHPHLRPPQALSVFLASRASVPFAVVTNSSIHKRRAFWGDVLHNLKRHAQTVGSKVLYRTSANGACAACSSVVHQFISVPTIGLDILWFQLHEAALQAHLWTLDGQGRCAMLWDAMGCRSKHPSNMLQLLLHLLASHVQDSGLWPRAVSYPAESTLRL